ncbi:MAG TPA: sigma-70 family RNA polymerase sigma factor [Flavisolibacter sp.]|nr:sigma-70 family RNA polymerase sigma factor [Flavisolibacter sp.]
MTDQDHQRLLIAFRKGDGAAFEQVFKQYFKPLRLQAFFLLKNEEEAEDQVQQLFLDLWNKQLYHNVQQSLQSYLHTAIRNRCLNYLTRADKEIKMRDAYADHASVVVFEDNREQLLQRYLLAALHELPTQRSKAFHLVHLENKKYHEAAEEMGISVISLKSHLKLALKFLRMRLKFTTVHLFDK